MSCNREGKLRLPVRTRSDGLAGCLSSSLARVREDSLEECSIGTQARSKTVLEPMNVFEIGSNHKYGRSHCVSQERDLTVDGPESVGVDTSMASRAPVPKETPASTSEPVKDHEMISMEKPPRFLSGAENSMGRREIAATGFFVTAGKSGGIRASVEESWRSWRSRKQGRRCCPAMTHQDPAD